MTEAEGKRGRIVVAHPDYEMEANAVAHQEGIEQGRVQFSQLVPNRAVVYVVDLDELYRFPRMMEAFA